LWLCGSRQQWLCGTIRTPSIAELAPAAAPTTCPVIGRAEAAETPNNSAPNTKAITFEVDLTALLLD
jgi:hypothetical protein